MKIALFLSLILLSLTSFAGDTLTPEHFGDYCPREMNFVTPVDVHTEKHLTYINNIIAKPSPLHKLECKKFDAKTKAFKSQWTLYFCENLDVKLFNEKEFYASITPWFTFHPNFKKVEFMLFPKYPKITRQIVHQKGKAIDLIGFNFMFSPISQMEIWFENTPENPFQKGAKSSSAVIFDNLKLQPGEDPIECEIL